VIATSAATAAWVAAVVTVLAATTTGVLAFVAFKQMRASKHQSDALNRQADAMNALAQTAAAQEFRDQMAGHSSIFRTPEEDMARALQGIAQTLARAYPPTPPGDEAEESPTRPTT
jgi:uncharacterized protein HemX